MATTNKHVKAVIQLRRAKEQEWIDLNPILRIGEPALSIDVNKLKVGNGKDHWLDIPYILEEQIAIVEELIEHGVYEAGNGITIENRVIALDDLILDCGTSTTNV